MDRPRLYLNHDADYDWLIALEYGVTDDGQRLENWAHVGEDFGFLLDRPVNGRCLGFRVNSFSEFAVESDDVSLVWETPRFEAPQLGLLDASAGEIIVASREFFHGQSSVNRHYFDLAIDASDDPEQAAFYWSCCLEAGDVMAHYGLSYTMLELDRPHDAYRHARAYTEISPTNAWAWCYRGQACEALGDPIEARQAYENAVSLEGTCGYETDAPERLRRLTSRAGTGN